MVRLTNSRVPAPPGALQDDQGVGSTGLRRSEMFRRLQMGGIGIVGVLVLIALASFIEERAKMSDRSAVPQAVNTANSAPSTAAPDPLAQAGVVPDVPASPSGSQKGTSAPAALTPAPHGT